MAIVDLPMKKNVDIPISYVATVTLWYGKSPFFMGKSTISLLKKLPEANFHHQII